MTPPKLHGIAAKCRCCVYVLSGMLQSKKEWSLSFSARKEEVCLGLVRAEVETTNSVRQSMLAALVTTATSAAMPRKQAVPVEVVAYSADVLRRGCCMCFIRSWQLLLGLPNASRPLVCISEVLSELLLSRTFIRGCWFASPYLLRALHGVQ